MPKRWQTLNQSLSDWRNQPQLERCHIFRHWMSEIPDHLTKLPLTQTEWQAIDQISRACDYFCTMAEIKLIPHLTHHHELITTRHYYQGKGVYCLGEIPPPEQHQGKPASIELAPAKITHFTLLVASAIAILLCGNGVFMHAYHPLTKWQKSLLISLFRALPSNLFQLTSSLSWHTIHQQPEIVGSVYIPHAEQQVTQTFQRTLLARQETLVQQVCLAPKQALAQVFHPDWLYQFCVAVSVSHTNQDHPCR